MKKDKKGKIIKGWKKAVERSKDLGRLARNLINTFDIDFDKIRL
jgi:hypothetical protein